MTKSQTQQVVLLASGGLDSTTLAYKLVTEGLSVKPIFVNYGQHCAQTEYNTLLDVLPISIKEKAQTINVADVYINTKSRLIDEANLWEDNISAEDLYLPYRNLLLLTVGAAFAQSHGYSEIYAAFINSNHAKEIDCSAQFFSALENLLADVGSVHINMPFRYMSKYEVARLGISLQVPVGRTFSCQVSSKIPCGACPNCVDRLEALRLLSK